MRSSTPSTTRSASSRRCKQEAARNKKSARAGVGHPAPARFFIHGGPLKPFRNRLRDALAPLIPVVQVALITAASIGNVLIAAAIFLNAKRLGALFLPALALYFVLLTVLLAAILRRRELDRLHALVGDEQFYEWYPRQRRRDERRRARMKRALEKHDREARRKEPKR